MAALFKRGPKLGPIASFKTQPKVSIVAAFKTQHKTYRPRFKRGLTFRPRATF